MSNWKSATIADVTLYQRAGGTPTATNNSYYGEEIPFVVIEDITKSSRYLTTTKKFLSQKGLVNSAAWFIKEPHVLYSMYATVGKPIINHISCATNQAIIALKENDLIEQEFLYYQLFHIRPSVYKYTAQTTQSNLNASVVKSLPISYPSSKKIQKKIIKILSCIDHTIEKTESLIEKYQQIKTGLMQNLFTHGIGPDSKLRPPREHAPELYHATVLGWLPIGWRCDTLESVLAAVPNNMRSGPFGSALLKSELVEDGIPFLGIDNIHIEKFVPNYKRFVSERKFNELNKYAVRPKDVVITIMGTVGRSAVIPDNIEKALSSKHLWTMTLDADKVIPELICWQLNYASWVKSWFRRETQGGIMDAIQSKTLKKLKLPFPPIDEQNEILKRYAAITNKIVSEQNKLNKYNKIKVGLMGDLLTGKKAVSTQDDEAVCV
jgi:type I restriction enzyme S subunit